MTFNLEKRTSQIHSSVKRIISVKEKLSIITIIFLVIGFLTMGEILVEVNSPSTIRPVGKMSFLSGFYEFPIRPYEIYEIKKARLALSVATGQSVSINVTTTNLTALKLTPVVFASTEPRLNLDPFDPNNPLVSFNTTHHLFTLPPAEHYTVYRAFIKNLTNHTVYFDGYIKSSGFNHDFLWVPLFLLSCYGLIVGGSFGIRQIISFFNRKKHNNTKKVIGTADQSFLSSSSRIKLLWKLHRQEIVLLRVIIITLLMWFALQPMITMNFFFNSCHTWQAVLENAEIYLVTPLNRAMLLIAALIVIDTSEVIVSKIVRRNIMVTLSLPFKRLEWLLSSFIWIFYRYGLVFVIIFFIKVFVISLQIRLIYPWLSLIGWLSLFLCSFLAWISIGLLASSTSNTRVGATIKGLVAVLIGLIFIHNIGGGHYKYFGDYGILNIEGIAYSFWHHFGGLFFCEKMPVVQVQGILVQTPPYLDNLVVSARLLGLWFLLSVLVLCFVIRKYEVN